MVTPLDFTAAVFGISILAGLLGSLLGLDGGIVVVPALTLLFRIDIRYAIGAFALESDRAYVIITTIVLLLLILSFVLGKAEG